MTTSKELELVEIGETIKPDWDDTAQGMNLVPVGFLLISATFLIASAFGGSQEDSASLGFAVGVLIYTVFHDDGLLVRFLALRSDYHDVLGRKQVHKELPPPRGSSATELPAIQTQVWDQLSEALRSLDDYETDYREQDRDASKQPHVVSVEKALSLRGRPAKMTVSLELGAASFKDNSEEVERRYFSPKTKSDDTNGV